MPRSEVVYVVQMRETIDLDTDEPRERWFDIATVTVPAKTKRKTVITKAIEQAESLKMDGEVLLRVIPADDAVAIPVEWEQPPPQLRIG